MAKKAKKCKKAKKKTKAAARKGDVVIITAASGVKPTKVLSKFNAYLRHQKHKRVEVFDFEDLLIKNAVEHPICKASPRFQRELQDNLPIIAVTSLPYPLLKSIWDCTAKEVCTGIEKTINSGQDIALVLHAVYFNADSTEFVPIVDATALQGIEPKCVVHLIDDIYDIYEWLRAPGGIFDHTDFPEDKFEQMQRCIRDLMNILIWRQAEAGASAHLAGLLGNVPLFTVATKHRCRLLQRIFEMDVNPVYLSHPISEARKQATAGDKELFEKWAGEVGNLADHLSSQLGVWEPTMIDELRFQVVEVIAPADEDGTVNEITLHAPRLLLRWPFHRVDEFLWSQPPQPMGEPLDPALLFTSDEIKEIEAAETWEQIVDSLGEEKSTKLRFISGQLAHLKSLITAQINARDRTLVGQCPSIILYRPVFNGSKATGVVRELEAHRRLVELQHYAGQPQMAVFVLESSDDEKLVWRNTVRELLIAPKGRWSNSAKEEDGSQLSTQKAQEIADFVTKNKLDPTQVVNEMHGASQTLNFRWGTPPQSALDGAAKGTAWVDFKKDRTQELEHEIQARMKYAEVLKSYEEGTVFQHKDIGLIDFAKKVVKVLTNQEG